MNRNRNITSSGRNRNNFPEESAETRLLGEKGIEEHIPKNWFFFQYVYRTDVPQCRKSYHINKKILRKIWGPVIRCCRYCFHDKRDPFILLSILVQTHRELSSNLPRFCQQSPSSICLLFL